MCCNQSSSYAAKQNKTLNDTINNDDDDDDNNNNRLILWHNAASLTRIDRSVVFAGWRQCAPHGYSAYASLRKDLLVCETDRRTQTTDHATLRHPYEQPAFPAVNAMPDNNNKTADFAPRC